MRIDQDTGGMALPEIDAVISPALSRSQFLQTPAFSTARVSVRNEPWCSYILHGIPQPETELSICFQFHGEQLVWLQLFHSAERFGTSWDDWSEPRERARKAYHERWLAEELRVRLGGYPWGSISSEFDPRAGDSSIVVSYERRNA